jgi:hypothetical protein
LLKEAEKKFATTASKIQLFKNNLIESGIALSEGFLPAVGRALDRLSKAFKDPGTKADIKRLGEDIGAAIDDIDWDAVLRNARDFVGVLKGALSFVLLIVNAVNKLPGEIKAAGAGFLALNKLSGGLIGEGVGNIVGGAAQGLASRIPGPVGKLFAQPVFVTNWPVGFGPGTGLPGAGGKPGVPPRPGGIITPAIGAGAILTPELMQIANNKLEQIKQRIYAQPLKPVAPPMSPDERQAFNDQRTRLQMLALTTQRQGERTVQTVAQAKAAVDASKALLAQRQSETKRETSRGVTATQAVRNAELATANRVVAATAAQTGAIVGAIWAARPVVNVTNVTKTVNNHARYGPSTGSSGANMPGQSGV